MSGVSSANALKDAMKTMGGVAFQTPGVSVGGDETEGGSPYLKGRGAVRGSFQRANRNLKRCNGVSPDLECPKKTPQHGGELGPSFHRM